MANAAALAKGLQGEGWRLVSGGTDTHPMLVEVKREGREEGRRPTDRLGHEPGSLRRPRRPRPVAPVAAHERPRDQQVQGDGFGSKIEPGKYTMIAALLARKTGRPVRCFVSREESFLYVGNRPPNTLTLKAGARKDGTLTALQLTGLGTSGAYPDGSGASYLVTDRYSPMTMAPERTRDRRPGGSLRPPRARRRGARTPVAGRRAGGPGSSSRSCRGRSRGARGGSRARPSPARGRGTTSTAR